MAGELRITISSDIDTEVFEELEDKIRDLLEQEGLEGVIEDFRTGNTTRTRDEDTSRNGKECKDDNDESLSDQNIRGMLTLGEKIWFNDDVRCRLRICGFSREDIKRLRSAKFVDLTITDYKDENVPGVIVHISEFGDEMNIESLAEICS